MVADDADDVRSLRILGFCLTLAVVVYWPILRHGFLYEDVAWRLSPGSPESWWQPGNSLAKALWVPNPFVMHGVSLLLHLVCGVMVFAVARAVNWPLPGVVAGLFLLHPLNSEAVAYASAFSHLLATAFILLALLGYLVGFWPFVLMGLFWALHANPSGVVVLGLLALLWWRDGGRFEDHASLVVIGLVLLVGAVWLAQGRYALPGSESVSWTHWWSLQATALFRLVGLAIYPIGFSVDPGVELSPIWILMLAGGTLAGVCAWAAYGALDPERPNGLFALAWVLVAVLPRFVVRAPLAILCEHQFYAASIGLALGGAWILNSAKTQVVDKQNLKVVP